MSSSPAGAQEMVSGQSELGVLFADISDSSYLFKAYGDEGARDVLLECLHIMRGVVEASPGRVVEKIGDELLTVFPGADSALHGAVDLQTAVTTARGRPLPDFLSLRVGFHFGAVVSQGDSLFGETVYTANRVCALAKGNQILTTGDTVERLPAELRRTTHFIGERTLKGSHQVRRIYRVNWDDPFLTGMPPEDVPTRAVPELPRLYDALLLTFGDLQIKLSSSNSVCLIGRSERCDIKLRATDVSRVHTRVEYRNGRIVVVDQSRNGTVVRPAEGARVFIQEGEVSLDGSGAIQPSQADAKQIRYTCIEVTENGVDADAPPAEGDGDETD